MPKLLYHIRILTHIGMALLISLQRVLASSSGVAFSLFSISNGPTLAPFSYLNLALSFVVLRRIPMLSLLEEL